MYHNGRLFPERKPYCIFMQKDHNAHKQQNTYPCGHRQQNNDNNKPKNELFWLVNFFVLKFVSPHVQKNHSFSLFREIEHFGVLKWEKWLHFRKLDENSDLEIYVMYIFEKINFEGARPYHSE